MTEEPETLSLINPVETPSYSVISYPASKLPKQYEPMLFSRWLRSLRFGNNIFRKISSNDYFDTYHAFVEKLLAKPDSIVRLAVLSDDHDVVLGFSVSREDVLDYIHVHSDYRKIGIGRALIPEGITTFTHITSFWLTVWQRKGSRYKALKFNPFA